MNILKKSLLAVALVSLPVVAFAQRGEDGYGDYGRGYGGWGGYGADEYGHHFDVSSGRGQQPQDCNARDGMQKCKVDAGFTFPPRM